MSISYTIRNKIQIKIIKGLSSNVTEPKSNLVTASLSKLLSLRRAEVILSDLKWPVRRREGLLHVIFQFQTSTSRSLTVFTSNAADRLKTT